MGSKSQLFHYDEVAKHNHKKDCWIIISGKVYDVTPFLEEHPGGDEVLLLAVEKDATDDFNDVGHSDSAREQMEKFYVGKVDTSTIPAQPNYKLPAQAAAQSEQSSGLLEDPTTRRWLQQLLHNVGVSRVPALQGGGGFDQMMMN